METTYQGSYKLTVHRYQWMNLKLTCEGFMLPTTHTSSVKSKTFKDQCGPLTWSRPSVSTSRSNLGRWMIKVYHTGNIGFAFPWKIRFFLGSPSKLLSTIPWPTLWTVIMFYNNVVTYSLGCGMNSILIFVHCTDGKKQLKCMYLKCLPSQRVGMINIPAENLK